MHTSYFRLNLKNPRRKRREMNVKVMHILDLFALAGLVLLLAKLFWMYIKLQ